MATFLTFPLNLNHNNHNHHHQQHCDHYQSSSIQSRKYCAHFDDLVCFPSDLVGGCVSLEQKHIINLFGSVIIAPTAYKLIEIIKKNLANDNEAYKHC